MLRCWGLLLWSMAGLCCANEQVVWINTDFPPFIIDAGPKRGQGVMDQVERIFQQQLPQYRHTRITASFPRVVQQIQSDNNVCTMTLLKSAERESYIVFSEPYGLIHTNKLVVVKGTEAVLAPYLNSQHQVELAKLMASNHFALGVASGRYYGSHIQTQLDPANPLLVRPSGREQLAAQMRMLVAQPARLNGLIGYPFEVEFILSLMGRNYDDVSLFDISGDPEFQLAYMGCSNTEFGRYVVDQIDRYMAEGGWKIIIDSISAWGHGVGKDAFLEANRRYFSQKYPSTVQ